MYRLTPTILLLAQAIASPVLAGPAQHGDPRTAVASLPGNSTAQHVISSPGSYVLHDNLLGASGKTAILVQASDVTIDLDGYSLRGVPGALNGIWDGDLALQNVALLDGSVTDFPLIGVSLVSTRYGLVDGVSVANCDRGMDLGNDFLVHEFAARDNTNEGINVLYGACVVDGAARDNWLGVRVSGGAVSEGGTLIADSSFHNNEVWPGREAVVVRCDFDSEDPVVANPNLLFPGTGTLITECRFRAPTYSYEGNGIRPGASNLVIHNEFHGVSHGILALYGRSWIRENRFVVCEEAIQSLGGNLITNNTGIGCPTDFLFGTGDTYGAPLTPQSTYFSDARPWANVAW